MNIAQHLAATLKTLRQQRGWSLSRLAEETGVSKAMLGQIERNESSPTVATLWKIATGLNVAFSTFIVADDDDAPAAFDPQQHLDGADARPAVAARLAGVHDVVHRAGAVADDTGAHQRPRVLLVFAMQHRRDRFLEVLKRDVGDKAQAPLVDADERRAVPGQMAADAQHGTVAADHQTEVAAATQSIDIHAWISLQLRINGRLGIQNHLAAQTTEK